MSRDSNRTRIWFPMFSYFESSVDGIIPNEYDSVENVLLNIFSCISYVKDCCMLTARRFWIAHNQLTPLPAKNIRPNTALNNLHLSNSTTSSNSSKGNGNLMTTNDEHNTSTEDIKHLLNKDIQRNFFVCLKNRNTNRQYSTSGTQFKDRYSVQKSISLSSPRFKFYVFRFVDFCCFSQICVISKRKIDFLTIDGFVLQ